MIILKYQTSLENKKVRFQYKKTKRSRKWINGFISLCYTKIAYQYAVNLQKQENFYNIRFITLDATKFKPI